jgi:endonuclease-3
MADARRIAALLFAKYPEPKIALHHRNPLELLIAVILSAQCTDARVNEVTATLFRKYRKAQDYAAADPDVLAEELRPTGFYRNKTRAVIGCCRKLVADFDGEVPRTLDALTTLPGVGRKTANMVLGNAFGVPAIAVDTHVLRVSQRLGLAHSGDPAKVEAELMEQVEQGSWTAFGNALILHGRETCVASRPHCPACVLREVCEWPEKTQDRR